ncbi:hypothetical protein Nepgr_016634 [Nepenthes gracilis]|uniref:Protein kinase domain-containing protein n=1 Tax=Nepenthes gracilis TaxID=150966 RepID=A0AAD3SN25_NEPGR|nr:hypothetical protein Nepgr_016634 [Nepenthes gracilis]
MTEWVRGRIVGRGSFGMVNLAIPRKVSSENMLLMVAKSCEDSKSDSLKNEKEVLLQLQDCPQIVRFLGDDLSVESGKRFYNLLFEYAPNGTLADRLKSSGGRFTDSDIRRYTKSVLQGLSYIHEKGFVHCDIKLQNILLFRNNAAKIADFGLAKRAAETEKEKDDLVLRGTPLYMSPEVVKGGDCESPADLWALGCAVVEMITGKPAWGYSAGCDVNALLYKIAIAGEAPEIPAGLCSEGNDFLGKCFAKDPSERWTARMLLDHPFVSGFDDDGDGDRQACSEDVDDHDPKLLSTSPSCQLDFSIAGGTPEIPAGFCSEANEFDFADETAEIPTELCSEGSDLISKCFAKDPSERRTTRMLSEHPFVFGFDDGGKGQTRACYQDVDDHDRELPSPSPRCPLDFADWMSFESSNLQTITSFDSPEHASEAGFCGESNRESRSHAVSDRLRLLVSDHLVPDWSCSDKWIIVR